MNRAMNEKCYSQRRACALVGIAPRVHRYAPNRPDDAGLRERLKELSSERRRFGYRRLHILLKREGVEVNWIGARQANDPVDRLPGGNFTAFTGTKS